ncbi:MAG TPA: hypothetical protein PJ991_13260, partial [Kiritimatiellia bacterium]|nr:hypothetical protein [Kiritimatiellia bacterium]
TGNPVVRNVVRSRDVFHGEFMNRLPDLLVEWSNERYTTSVWSPKAGMIHGAWNLPRTGNHTSRGVIFSQPLTGQFKTPCKPSSVMDIGPTICRALGVELQNVDGHIIEGLLC